ncbi:hypothetical protein [Prevotella sp. E2-28]|jgi:hypothetical protein|uniref:hypothetical protein n=1 Tax=Prevotella sp. E2-28 TaxID=2913620 RepID=UPI001EDC7272|nr:hypothetical protein [Prevotella sp. E2-28]UKK55188.1 hypothetical protein L6465_14290 [Prevotella sp. E2-28]
MADCKYCGRSAGIFSHAHKECEESHNQGVTILEGAIRSYFKGATPMSEIVRVANHVKQNNYISDKDRAESSSKCIDEWTNTIHWPFHSSHLDKIKEFITNIGVSYQDINGSGALDRLCQKMIRGFMAEYFTGQKPLQRSLQISQQVMRTLPLTVQKEQEAYYEMLGQAGKNFLKDGLMSPSEQQKVDEYIGTLGLSLINLPPSLKGTPIEEMGQASILSDIQAGRTPRYNLQAPIILGRGETAFWCYNNVTMFQEKVRREYVGRTGGFSFRIIKGVTYRTGGFKGHPVETSFMENMGVGSLYVTNKHIIFMGQMRSIKVPYSKIIGINPFSDGMEVQRDGNNVKRLVFQGFDCTFILNVLALIN